MGLTQFNLVLAQTYCSSKFEFRVLFFVSENHIHSLVWLIYTLRMKYNESE